MPQPRSALQRPSPLRRRAQRDVTPRQTVAIRSWSGKMVPIKKKKKRKFREPPVLTCPGGIRMHQVMRRSLSQLCFPLVIPAQTFVVISINTAHGFKAAAGTMFALFIGNTSSHQKINETPGKTSCRAKAWWDSSHLPVAPRTAVPAALVPGQQGWKTTPGAGGTKWGIAHQCMTAAGKRGLSPAQCHWHTRGVIPTQPIPSSPHSPVPPLQNLIATVVPMEQPVVLLHIHLPSPLRASPCFGPGLQPTFP